MTPDSRSFALLGTPLLATTYDDLIARCQALARAGGTYAIDFTNTHIVTLRRHDRHFRALTNDVDYFVPDGMPLIWCLNRRGAELRDRVYGPTFMRRCLETSGAPWKHLFVRRLGRLSRGAARQILPSGDRGGAARLFFT